MNPAAPPPLPRSPPLSAAPPPTSRPAASTQRIPLPLRCVHCHTTETPLWRAGPAGPKTLCNACGVRWKKTGSVIPRSKRPSTALPASQISPIRKRARTASTSTSPAPPAPHSDLPLPPASPPDPRAAAAAAAAAALPAPKPVSVFRVADAARSKYESVFSGLMVVNRAAKPADDDPPRGRTRTQTTRGSAFFAEFAPPPPLKLPAGSPIPPLPCPSPPPVEKDDEGKERGGVYVTEVHAPSPSPSPPPMPRVQRRKEGGGFTLLLAAVADERKQPQPM